MIGYTSRGAGWGGERLGFIVYLLIGLVWSIYSVFAVYSPAIYSYASILVTEEYNYIIALFFVLVFLAVRRINGITQRYGDYIVNLLLGLMLLTSSMLVYLFSLVSAGLMQQLQVFAIILWFWGSAAIFLGLGNFRRLFPVFAAMLLLIPIPRVLIDYAAVKLSYTMGYAASLLTGARLETSEGYVVLKTSEPGGRVVGFSIVAGCSGIVSLASALTIAPMILDLAASSPSPRGRKIAALAASLGLLAGLSLLGNVLRISMVVWATQAWGQREALELFHKTPSILFAALTYPLSLLVLRRMIRLELPPVSLAAERIRDSLRILGKTMESTRARVLLLVTLIMVSAAAAALPAASGPGEAGEEAMPSASYLASSITAYFPLRIRQYINIYSVSRMSDWEIRTGIPLIILAHANINGSTLYIYVEGSSSPTLFHEWPICLTSQRYDVLKTWREKIEVNGKNYTVDYIAYKRKRYYGLLAYTFIAVPSDYGGVKGYFYLKVTFLTQWPVTQGYRVDEVYPVVTGAAEEYLRFLDREYGLQGSGEEASVYGYIALYSNVFVALLGASLAYILYAYMLAPRLPGLRRFLA